MKIILKDESYSKIMNLAYELSTNDSADHYTDSYYFHIDFNRQKGGRQKKFDERISKIFNLIKNNILFAAITDINFDTKIISNKDVCKYINGICDIQNQVRLGIGNETKLYLYPESVYNYQNTNEKADLKKSLHIKTYLSDLKINYKHDKARVISNASNISVVYYFDFHCTDFDDNEDRNGLHDCELAIEDDFYCNDIIDE